MNKQDLKSKIEKLEKGIASKVTPENLKASLKSQKEKFEKELVDLEKKEKSDLSKKIKDLKASVKTKSTKSGLSRDGARKAKAAGKRIAEDGSVYYEKRANRTDSQTKNKPYLEDGGYMNEGGDLESFEKKVKDAMKQPNKWYFMADYVGDKKVQLKMFVGVKEVDVQIFKIGGIHAKMPRNYSNRRDTLKMIMDNFEPKMAKGGLIKISASDIEDSDFQYLSQIFESNDAMFSIDESEEYILMDFRELPDGEEKEEAMEIIGKYDVQKMAKGGELDKSILKNIYKTYDIYKDGKNQEHYNDFNDSVKVRNHIESTTGLKVLDIKEIEIGKNYPDNFSNPYYYDTYEVKLSKGKPFVIERMYGRPRWTGNVAYTNGIDVKELYKMAKGGTIKKAPMVYEFKAILRDEDDNIKEKKEFKVKATGRDSAYNKAYKKYPKPYFVELYNSYEKGGDLYDDMNDDIEFANKKAKMVANSLKGMGYNIVEFTEADYDADANISLSENVNVNVDLDGEFAIVVDEGDGKFLFMDCGKSYATVLEKLQKLEDKGLVKRNKMDKMEKGGKAPRTIKLTLSDKDSYDYTYKQDGTTGTAAEITFGFGKEPFQYEVKKISKSLEPLKQDILDAFTIQGIKQHEYKGGFSEAIKHLDTKVVYEDNFAKGGNVKLYDKNEAWRLSRPSGSIEKDVLSRVQQSEEDFVGNFGWKTSQGKTADGYLYKLNDFDQDLVKDIKLKDGEKIYRYFNRTSAIGGMKPLIKINVDKELLYFLANLDDDGIEFEKKGIQALWIALIEDKMAGGGFTSSFSGTPDRRRVTMAKGGYVVVEGFDHRKNEPLYRVISRDKDNDYVGEWYTLQEDAENEYKSLVGNWDDEVKIVAEGGKMAKGGESDNGKWLTTRNIGFGTKYKPLSNGDKVRMNLGNGKYYHGTIAGKEILWEDGEKSNMQTAFQGSNANDKEVLRMADGGVTGANKKIKDFYIDKYPMDELGIEINEESTFDGLYEVLDYKGDVYHYIGVNDSLVRERVFEKLSELKGVDYDVIYQKWLDSDYADGGMMAKGGKVKVGKTTFDNNFGVDDKDFETAIFAYYDTGSQDNVERITSRTRLINLQKKWGDEKNKEVMEYIKNKYKNIGIYADGGSVGQNLNVFGYETLNFDLCPLAVEEFEKAVDVLGQTDSDAKKTALSRAAMYVDDVLGVEKKAKEDNIVSKNEFLYAVNQSIVASAYNYASGLEVNLNKFIPIHIFEIAAKLVHTDQEARKDELTSYDMFVAKGVMGDAVFNNMTQDERRNLAMELKQKKSFEDGGSIEESNYRMVVSQAKAIKHHADELLNVLTPDTSVEAWVVGKIERASTDLSDITHYIDGLSGESEETEVVSDTYFAEGGKLEKGVYYLGKPKKEGSVWAQKIVELDETGLSFATDYARKLKDFPSKDYKKISEEELSEFIKNSPKHQNVSSDISKFEHYAAGGMIVGRWYKDNQGVEHRYIGENRDGQPLFSDGEKVAPKSLDEFESDVKETKLFRFFENGGETSGFSNARLLGRESQDFEKEAREYAGADWDKLSKDEKRQIISDLEKDFDRNSHFAKGGEIGSYEVVLSAAPNVDYEEIDYRGYVQFKPKKKKVKSIEDAQKTVRKFIEDNELGGGNWNGGDVYKDGVKIGYISYNGRFWDKQNMAQGGQLNIGVRKLAASKGFTPKALGKDYEKVMAQAVVEALTDANYHEEARKLVSILEKNPKIAEKPNYPSPADPKFSEKMDEIKKVYGSEYFEPDEKTRAFARKVSQEAEFDGYEIANAFEFVLKMDGGYHKLANDIKKAVESSNEMAKGGGIYSSDSLYYLQVLKDGEEVGREKFRAKSLKEAREIAEDDYEKDYQSKFGDHLSFIVSEAMEKGGETGNWKKNRTRKLKTKEEAEKAIKLFAQNMGKVGRNYKVEKMDDGYIISYESNFSDGMAEGGMTEHGLRIGDKVTTDMFWDNQIVVENTKTHKRAQIDLETGKRKDEMADGGVIKVGDYIRTKDGMKGKLMNIEGENLEVKKITKQRFPSGMRKFYHVEYDGYTYDVRADLVDYDKMAMGGKVKFEDKVKAIKASLLKKKKVSPKVQKDYGKTYSPKEAEQSAKRIVGSMRKKGMK